jgi:hypothetical protein
MFPAIPLSRSQLWTILKWSLMWSAIFWMIVFRLSQQVVRLPEFVYVNF